MRAGSEDAVYVADPEPGISHCVRDRRTQLFRIADTLQQDLLNYVRAAVGTSEYS
jgi:hypothetical protein